MKNGNAVINPTNVKLNADGRDEAGAPSGRLGHGDERARCKPRWPRVTGLARGQRRPSPVVASADRGADQADAREHQQ